MTTHKHFAVGQPIPLGQKRPVLNNSQSVSVDLEELVEGIVGAMLPAVQAHIDKRLNEAGITQDTKPGMAANTSRTADQWDGYNLATGFDDLPD